MAQFLTKKNVIDHKMCVLIFSKTLVSNTSHYKKMCDKFSNICPVGAELFHADRRIDMRKLIVAFHEFANAPKNVYTSSAGTAGTLAVRPCVLHLLRYSFFRTVTCVQKAGPGA